MGESLLQIKARHPTRVLIVGRGGQVILKDYPDVLQMRITAPLEVRLLRAPFHGDERAVLQRLGGGPRMMPANELRATTINMLKHVTNPKWPERD
jgi:hypothetical protein